MGGLLLHLIVFLLGWSSPLDHCLRRAVEEDEFGNELLLERHVTRLPHQVDVIAQMQDALHVRQFVKHDVVCESARLHAYEAADDQDEGHVQANDAVRRR